MKPGTSYRILVIDDDAQIHSTFAAMLAPEAGHLRKPRTHSETPRKEKFPVFEIDVAFDGREGWRLVQTALREERPYTLAFVDLRMPSGWDGLETISHLWKECADLQIVICTGHRDYSWHNIIERFGHTDRLLILKKPFDVTEVRQIAYALAEKWSLFCEAQNQVAHLQKVVTQRTAKLEKANLSLQKTIAENARAERRLFTQYAVNQTLGEAATLADASARVLKIVCENLNWSWGALWRVDEEDSLLKLAHDWHAQTAAMNIFKVVSAHGTFALGGGLPGHVWETRQPIWLADWQQHKNFLRAEAIAEKNALRGAIAFPIWTGAKFFGVLEFIGGEILERDAHLMQTLAVIGSGLGQFIERKKEEDERRAIELKLRQSQKLESIGQLAAGIAHEINTPTQFIGDNIQFLQTSFRDLHQLQDAYEKLFQAAQSQESLREFIAEIAATKERMDLKFLWPEIPKAIEQSVEGLNNVTRLIRAMNEFSHPEASEKTPIDLNQVIEATLTLARNEWKYVAEIVRHFDESLPLVPCLPGSINQVILNLVVNAAHAIEERPTHDKKGTITIQTRHRGDRAEIRIEDTGVGIPESIHDKIFDPFFTTKPLGKGTGQGLALAHAVIVDQHKGLLNFESKVGQGTAFIIQLPIQSNGRK